MLAHPSVGELQDAGLRLLFDHEVVAIDPATRTLHVRHADGDSRELPYGTLVVGTGARPVIPPLPPGIDLPGVHVLHTIDEARQLDAAIDGGAQRAVLIGSSYIGTELADALTRRGLDVAVVERAPAVLTTFDADLRSLMGDELRRHGVSVHTSTTVERIAADGPGLRVLGTPDPDLRADLAVIAVGVRPEADLLARAGATLTSRGALAVDNTMHTGLDRIWAAGDCVHTHHVLLDEPTYLPLGTTAHKQGRGPDGRDGHRLAGSGGSAARLRRARRTRGAASSPRPGKRRSKRASPVLGELDSQDETARHPKATTRGPNETTARPVTNRESSRHCSDPGSAGSEGSRRPWCSQSNGSTSRGGRAGRVHTLVRAGSTSVSQSEARPPWPGGTVHRSPAGPRAIRPAIYRRLRHGQNGSGRTTPPS
jgi:thioredoxin reductase